MNRFFSAACIGAILALLLAIVPIRTLASTMVIPLGAAQATLDLTPDPPTTGRITGMLRLTGAPAAVLARTTASFSSTMPTMSMNGPSGALYQTGPGQWTLGMSVAMATTWTITVHFSGGITGTATYRFAVGGEGGRGTTAMSGMSSSAGNPDAWRDAAIALAVVLLVGILLVVVRGDRRPLTLGIIGGAAVLITVLAVVSARYAAPAMDMAAMSTINGNAATPVTLALVRSNDASADIHVPGSIAPYLMQDIVTRAPGILREFSVYAGDDVRAGQVIARLDAPDLQSRAIAAAADAASQADVARAADVEANHHAPNGVVIARSDRAAIAHDLDAAQSDRSSKAEARSYWEAELRREKTLLDQGGVSTQEYQDERTQRAAADAAYRTATEKVASLEQQVIVSSTKVADAGAAVEQMLAQASAAHAAADRAAAQAVTERTTASFTSITSPDDAIVVKRLVDPGVFVQAGTTIARIAVVRRLRVQANVAQQDLPDITIGTPIDARRTDDTLVRGRITSISPVADATSHTALVEAIVDNSSREFVPGGFVQVTIHARRRSFAGTLAVPSTAVVGSGSDAAVWADVNGTAHRVAIRVRSDDGTTASVTGDLDRKTRVVVDGAATLQEGQNITESRS